MSIGKLLVLPAQLFCCCIILPVCLFFYKLVCFVLLFNPLLCLSFSFCWFADVFLQLLLPLSCSAFQSFHFLCYFFIVLCCQSYYFLCLFACISTFVYLFVCLLLFRRLFLCLSVCLCFHICFFVCLFACVFTFVSLLVVPSP